VLTCYISLETSRQMLLTHITLHYITLQFFKVA